MALSEISDKNGNRLFFKGNEVFLRLRSENRIRKLGEITGNTLHTIRDLGKHEMRNRCEVGFNFHLIKFGRFTNIVVHTQDEEFETTRRWVLKYGKTCMPGGRKYELQIFLKISDFVGFIEPPEDPQPEVKHDPVQPTLFAQQEVIT